jgi:hypothetical protein
VRTSSSTISAHGDPETTPTACKLCGKLTTRPQRRPIFGPSTKPKRLCPSCTSDFDRRRSRTGRAIRFLLLATASASAAVGAFLVAFRLAFGPPTSKTVGAAFVVVAIPYLLAIRRRFGLGLGMLS